MTLDNGQFKMKHHNHSTTIAPLDKRNQFTWCAACQEWYLPTERIGRSRKAAARKTHRAVLVYQGGIANVFAVEAFNMSDYGRDARRLLQHAFGPCEWFACGLAAAGVKVATAHCNQAGDIIHATWSEDLDAAPFSEQFHPVWEGVSR